MCIYTNYVNMKVFNTRWPSLAADCLVACDYFQGCWNCNLCNCKFNIPQKYVTGHSSTVTVFPAKKCNTTFILGFSCRMCRFSHLKGKQKSTKIQMLNSRTDEIK